MKRTLTLSLAFSLLSATAAFASPQTAQPLVADAATQIAVQLDSNTREERLAESAGSKTFDRASVDLNSKVTVAENRKEFGSQYQRY